MHVYIYLIVFIGKTDTERKRLQRGKDLPFTGLLIQVTATA